MGTISEATFAEASSTPNTMHARMDTQSPTSGRQHPSRGQACQPSLWKLGTLEWRAMEDRVTSEATILVHARKRVCLQR